MMTLLGKVRVNLLQH